MNKFFGLLITLLVIYSLVLVYFYLSQSRMLFYPQPLSYPVQDDETIEEVHIATTHNESLHGWLCKSQEEGAQKLIIYFGGNAEEVSHMTAMAPLLEDWAILLVNYPGYGNSQGKPGEKSFYRAALDIYDYAITREDVDPENIVLMGRSIGCGSAVFLASERKAKGVVLISPFESIRAVAQSKLPFLPVGLLLRHPFDAKKYAGEINAPLLAFYGSEDNIIPPRHSMNLVEYWKGSHVIIELTGYGHNDVLESQQLWDEINWFLRSLDRIAPD